jgi:hypothetical protein
MPVHDWAKIVTTGISKVSNQTGDVVVARPVPVPTVNCEILNVNLPRRWLNLHQSR